MKKILLAAIASTLLVLPAVQATASSYTKTKYPIVLVHGFSGFDNVGGVLGYFHTIPYNLQRSGAKVYVPSVSAFNSSQNRGQQLADYLNTLPESKFNLIGHSQGSPTSRVAAALAPDKVASVTSVSGANQGSKVADFLLGIVPTGFARDVVANVLNAAGGIINFLSGADNPQDALTAAESLSTAGSQALNEALDNKGLSDHCQSISENVSISGQNIKMFSWSGNRAFTNVFDITDGFLSVTWLAFAGEKNDGLVSVCSSKLGKVISTSYSLNHLDSVNQLFGVRGWTNPVSLYRSHANRLKNKNL